MKDNSRRLNCALCDKKRQLNTKHTKKRQEKILPFNYELEITNYEKAMDGVSIVNCKSVNL
jgi:hypothetical protein